MIKGRCLVGLIFIVVLISLNIDKSHGVFINHYILGSILIFKKAYEYVCIKKYSHLSNKREVTLTDFEKKIHLQRTFPPSTFIDFLDFFHPPLLVYCSYVLVFSKKSHPPRLFQPPRLLILQFLHPLHVYSNLYVY